MDKNKIMARLKSDYDLLVDMGYEVLGVFLQGSQNYHLDYEGSDIDTKAIVLPSFEDIVLNKRPASTTHVLPSDEHIDIKDIRLMHDCFRKQNINFLEILFTEYRYMNPIYAELYQPMFDNAEAIAHYNNYAAVNCIAGMAYEKHKALEHPYPATKDKIEKYGFDPKQLHHMLRCADFLIRYIDGESYRNCLIPTNVEDLIEIKAHCSYTLEQARAVANYTHELIDDVKKNYMETHEVCIDSNANDVMNAVLVSVLKKKMRIDVYSTVGEKLRKRYPDGFDVERMEGDV